MQTIRLCANIRLGTMAVCTLLSVGCVPADEVPTPAEVVDEAWTRIDTRYALFVDKPELDWDAARVDALQALSESDGSDDALFDALFDVLVDILDQLEDGHVNLEAPFGVSRSTSYQQDRVPTFDRDLVERHVLDFELRQRGALTWAVTPQGWGYLRVDDFTDLPGAETREAVFGELEGVPALVLDLRSNGGGELEQAGSLLGHLLPGRQVGWHVAFSTGPAHDALGDATPREVVPRTPRYDGPLAVLVDGRTYSAANTVVFALKDRPETTVVGQPTGGGGGSPTWLQLSNGWGLRFPTARLTGPCREAVEDGVEPDVFAEMDPSRPTHDAMIEEAVASVWR